MACFGHPTTQDTVLQAIVDKIRRNVVEFQDEVTCFMSTHPDPKLEDRQNLFCVVSPMTGDYDEDKWIGGGTAATVEHTGVQVTVWSQMELDRDDESTSLLMDDARGMFKLKRDLLKALLKVEATDTSGVEGNLQDRDGNNILTRPMSPQHSGHPNRDESGRAEFHLTFNVSFRWDLT